MDTPKLNLAEIEKKARAAELQEGHVTRRTLKGLEIEDLEGAPEEDVEEEEQ